jgi:chromosome segregation protein
MRLTKLTLAGFKSFADETAFEFAHPITGVVGPNGCGKSNVVDAIKWVLGERSSKSLRGTEMTDVIFAGSAGRKPMGMASVKLTFDNPVYEAPETPSPAPEASTEAGAEGTPAQQPQPSLGTVGKRGLAYDADVVEIERRLYRDGGSEYLINGKQARLKDIREMFMDTGVGADAYSIIEQGKVDAMLLASPQERRTIFEEAAGIAKYKQRRIEASRRMDRADANLKISKEQLESTERRLKLVKGQAAKARKYQELSSELRAWRLALAFGQYDELVTRIEGLTSQQQAASEARDAAHTHLAQVEAQREAIDQDRAEKTSQVDAAERARMAAEHARQQSAQRRSMLQRSVDDAARELGSLAASLDRSQQASEDGEVALVSTREQIAALSERLQDGERDLAAKSAARSAAASELEEKRRTAQEKFSAASRIDRERAQLTATVQSETRRAANVRENLQALSQRRDRFSSDQRTTSEQLSAMRDAAGTAKASVGELEGTLASLEGQLSELSSDRRAQAQRMSELDQERVRVESRLHALRELVENRAGFAESVRELLRRKDAAQKSGDATFASVRGALADVIRVAGSGDGQATDATSIDPRLAGLVELALGPDLDALLVDSTEDVPTQEALSSLPGRVVFLPLRDEHAAARATHTQLLAVLAEHGLLASDANPAGVVPMRGLVQPKRDASGAERAGDEALNHALDHQLDHQLDHLLDRLLGGTLLVQDLATAQLLIAGPLAGLANSHSLRFITAAGEVVDNAGRIVTGPTSKGELAPGLLRRQSEVEELARSLATTTQLAGKQRTLLQAADAESAALSARIAEARTKLVQQQRAAQSASSNVERLELDLARVGRELASLSQDQTRLEQTLAGIEGELAKNQQTIEGLSRLHQDQMEQARAAESGLQELARKSEGLNELVATARVLVGTLTQEQAGAKRELARLEQQREEAMRRMRDDRARIDHLQARQAEQRGAIAAAEAEIATAAAAIAASSEQLSIAAAALESVSVRATELAASVQAARQKATSLERDVHSLEVSRRELEVKREGLEERTMADLSVDIRSELMEYRATLGPMERQVSDAMLLDAGDDVPEAADESETLAVIEVEAQVASASSDTPTSVPASVLASLDEGVSEEDAPRAEETNAAASATQTVLQRWLVQTQAVLATAVPVAHAPAQQQIDDLRNAITKLGNVNMEALEEEQTLEGQNQELVRQVADLEAAREQLSTLIEQLNAASRERFGDVFGKIQAQFGGEHGMYRKLFGGGRAEVRLMPLVKEVEQPDGSIVKVETDETDLLESGIEVIAKPPGKEPRSISQLSGGEKTLTAVALLMSIFRSKPSCFCVLDEVDAALDEGNVGRFNACVRDFTDLSRFIIITHNKRTMQNADHLYGVTQQEKGVSTRVSVKFEQVGKDGRVDVSLKQPAAIAPPRTRSEHEEGEAARAEDGEVVVVPATKVKRATNGRGKLKGKQAAEVGVVTGATLSEAGEASASGSGTGEKSTGVAAAMAKLRELQ